MNEEPLNLEVQFRHAETNDSLDYARHRVMVDPAMLPHVHDEVTLSDAEGFDRWIVQRREFHFNQGLLIVRIYLEPKSAE